MAGSEPAALPLGYSPSINLLCGLSPLGLLPIDKFALQRVAWGLLSARRPVENRELLR